RMMDPDDITDDLQFGGLDGELLNEYAVGKNADVFPEGTGRLMKANTKLILDIHLHSTGETTAANAEIGLKFYPKGFVPKYIVSSTSVGRNNDLDIPPNTDNVRVDGYTTLTKPTRVLSFQPHMHNRGKAMCLEAIYPANGGGGGTAGNRAETLSCID